MNKVKHFINRRLLPLLLSFLIFTSEIVFAPASAFADDLCFGSCFESSAEIQLKSDNGEDHPKPAGSPNPVPKTPEESSDGQKPSESSEESQTHSDEKPSESTEEENTPQEDEEPSASPEEQNTTSEDETVPEEDEKPEDSLRDELATDELADPSDLYLYDETMAYGGMIPLDFLIFDKLKDEIMEKIRTMTPGGCVETYLEKIEKELGAGKLDEEGKRWLKMFNETVADAINLNVPLPQNIYSAYIKAVKLVKDAVKDLKDKNYVDGISKLVEGSFSSVGTIPIQPLGIIATVGKFGCRLIRNAFHSAKKRK